MKVNYSEFDLNRALEDLGEEGIQKVVEKLTAMPLRPPEGKAEINKTVAEYHGITVIDLINSPNYEKLCQQWGDSFYLNILNVMMKMGLNHTQACAVLYYAVNQDA